LNDTQKKRKSIRWIAFAVICGVILVAVAIVVAVMVLQNSKPKGVKAR
jgi:flagellar basal body-associated protein FliL